MKKKRAKNKQKVHSQKAKQEHKLRTSIDIYNQLCWDQRFDPENFFIGYEERYAGSKEIKVTKFVPNGEIPWHRIWYFRNEEEVVWDRKERIDRLNSLDLVSTVPSSTKTFEPPTNNTHTHQPQAPRKANKSFHSLSAFRYNTDAKKWCQRDTHLPKSSKKSKTHTLRILTLNVLFDTYDKERIQTPKRRPEIFRLLRESQADIIALQEVTASFLSLLLEQSWVKKQYDLTDSPDGNTIRPYGQIILSRFPITKLSVRHFSESKRAIIAELSIGEEQLIVAVVHLSSSRSKNAEDLRSEQLQKLLQYEPERSNSNQEYSWLLLGDFNERGEALSDLLMEYNFLDAWTELHPNSPGYTFDPQTNPLAAMQSLTGRQGRLDRMYFRSAGTEFASKQIRLFGTQTIDGCNDLHPSDHFGLSSTFSLEHRHKEPKQTQIEELCAKPTYRSALVIIPPEEKWEEIQSIRQKYDKTFFRWMPHINLVYGFLPEEHFEAAVPVIEAHLEKMQPFDITLESFAQFEHRASSTIFLQPDHQATEHLRTLQSKLEALFPLCNEQGQKSDEGFTPHLSVAQFRSKDVVEKNRHFKDWNRKWTELSFTVGEVHLISRRADEPFEIRHSVPFSSHSKTLEKNQSSQKEETWKQDPLLENILQQQGGYESLLEQKWREEIFAFVEQTCEECLLENDFDFESPIVHKVGSSKLDVLLSGNDLDIICMIPFELSKQSLLSYIQTHFKQHPKRKVFRIVGDAFVPVVKMVFDGLDVDLMFSRFPEGLQPCPPNLLHKRQLETFTAHDRRVLYSLFEAERMLAVAEEKVHLAHFKMALRCIKFWAKCRGLDSNALGFLGGFSWATMTTWFFLYAKETHLAPIHFLSEFFREFAAWDWQERIGLDTKDQPFRRSFKEDRMPIMTSFPPLQNSARNVTLSTFKILREEWKRAAQLLDAIENGTKTWEAFFAPRGGLQKTNAQKEESATCFSLVLSCPTQQSLALCSGWIEGKILSLVLELEKKTGATIYPYPVQQTHSKQREQNSGEKPKSCGITYSFGVNLAQRSLSREEILHTFEAFTLQFKSAKQKSSQVSLVLHSK